MDLSQVGELCDEYGYSAGIRTLLEEITLTVAIPGTRSIVLAGSGGRGELIYSESPAGTRIFSDLELTVVAEPIVPEDVTRATRRIAELERAQLEIGARTFHIDVVFATPQMWRSPQTNFQAWETRRTGWILLGEDVRPQLRADVDARNSIQSSLNRLWHLLLYLPEGLLRAAPSEADVQTFGYALNRAVLDFPLWLLSWEGVFVAGFAGRLRYLQEKGAELGVTGLDLEELVELVEAVSQDRTADRPGAQLGERYERTLRWYVAMLRWSLADTTIDTSTLASVLEERSSEIYPALGWKRILWELKMAVEVARNASPAAGLRWFRLTKQARITAFLWFMHQAACCSIDDRPDEADRWLRKAAAAMQDLWPAKEPTSAEVDPADHWIALRHRFFEFLMLYYRGLAQKESYYRFVMRAR